jgi:hypothetical protein
MEYILIDRDDIGRRITSCYITNDQVQLAKISTEMSSTVLEVSQLLKEWSISMMNYESVLSILWIEDDIDEDGSWQSM